MFQSAFKSLFFKSVSLIFYRIPHLFFFVKKKF
nr:MAG TPA: hypothetical protein [Caudoviricetes sp.]